MVLGSPSQQPSLKRSPKRKVLHERSQSQTNRITQRVVPAGAKQESITSTPFPTKPSHVLLPSSIKNRNGSGGISGASSAARVAKGGDKFGLFENRWEVPTAITHAEILGVQRSVSELRDLYENQAVLRPSTSHSARPSSPLSSALSSPALWGHTLSERLTENASFLSESDEIVVSESLRDGSFSIKKVISEASLPPLPSTPPDPSAQNAFTVDDSTLVSEGLDISSSSPNLIAFGSSSSVLDGSGPLSAGSSSPNFVLLGHSSSKEFDAEGHVSIHNIEPLQLTQIPASDFISSPSPNAAESDRPATPQPEGEAIPSSPNVITFGISSPNYITTKYDDAYNGSPDSLRTIKKRRGETVHEQPSISTISTSYEQFNSSPPDPAKPTSAADPRLPNPPETQSRMIFPAESSTLHAHEYLQNAIESSPSPDIQYPVVAAPTMDAWEGLTVPKRTSQHLPPTRWNPHLSTVPSEWSDENPLGSRHSLDTADMSDTYSIPELPQASPLNDCNITGSSTRMIPVADRREATDVVSDLQGTHLHSKISGFLSLVSGSSRSNSQRSFVLRRPNSNGSINHSVRFPAWARRYYTIGPSPSFYSLRPETSRSNLSRASRPSSAVESPIRGASVHLSPAIRHSSAVEPLGQRASAPISPAFCRSVEINPLVQRASAPISSESRCSPQVDPSLQRASVPNLFRPRTRAGESPRESHTLPGIGPLVSNPSQPSLSRVSRMSLPLDSRRASLSRVSRLSLPLDPADPRAHWAAAEQDAIEAELRRQSPTRFRPMDKWSPHLYPDNRASERKYWLAPSIDEKVAPIFSWRNAYTVGFMLGFLFPISWFVAAFLPLPERPDMRQIRGDPESVGPTLQEQLDHRAAVAQEARYANLRWWRNLNRFMCIVGLVVVSIVVSVRIPEY